MRGIGMQKQEKISPKDWKGNVVTLDGASFKTAEYLYQITLKANGNHTTWKKPSFQMELVDPNNLYLGYEENGELIGYIGCMLILDEGSINNYGILPEYKRKGIGAILMQHLLERCREKNIEKVFLEVRISNHPAISLYKKFGFEQIGYRKDYYLDPVEDAYLYWLSIDKTDE